ncbi:MAG TPA: hypothetical protein VMH87_04930 [Pseudomonadales bacterium]|nr:hypothetical protein [Pseudomonadales bacterium]
MKIKFNLPAVVFALLLFCILSLQTSTAFAQGSLTPPGAPAPAMKTLSQIEPRIPISSAPFTIAQPGSYYLTTNITVSTATAIIIATNGVTLDLSGFTISSTAVSANGTGISINSGLRNITIANGFIQGSVTNNGSGVYSGGGFSYGIYYTLNQPVNVLVSRVSISGCQNYGIFLNNAESTVVESCTVQTVGSYGIVASTIKQSSAFDCGGSAIDGDEVSDCRGQCTGNGTGVYGNVVQNCCGTGNNGNGVSANNTALNCNGSSSSYTGVSGVNVQNCYGYSAGYIGVSGSTVQNCYGSSNSSSGTGVNSDIAQSCYGFASGGTGVYADVALNCIGYSNGSGYGVESYYIANSCYGYCYSGTGVSASIAVTCHGTTSIGTSLSTSHNVNSY